MSSFRILEIRPDLTQIKLPLPFELREVNVHLLRHAGLGWVLFDTGFHAEECFLELQGALAHLGLAWADLDVLALTHLHPDHTGNAARILALAEGRPQVAMRADEAAYLNAIADAGMPPSFAPMLERCGTPADLNAAVMHAFRHVREVTRRIEPAIAFGETFAGFEVVHTPGHSPGHVCFLDRERQMFLSGDHMLPGITPNIGWLPGRDTLAEYLDSLRKVDPLPVQMVVPSHGKPFAEHRGWLRATAEHHEQRCAQIRGFLAQGRPLTAHEVVELVWPRKLAPFHYQFAASEILAHLEYMANQGMVEPAAPASESGGAVAWRALL